jgi:hypothetical protein
VIFSENSAVYEIKQMLWSHRGHKWQTVVYTRCMLDKQGYTHALACTRPSAWAHTLYVLCLCCLIRNVKVCTYELQRVSLSQYVNAVYEKVFALFLHLVQRLIYRLYNKRRPVLQYNYAIRRESVSTAMNETSCSWEQELVTLVQPPCSLAPPPHFATYTTELF